MLKWIGSTLAAAAELIGLGRSAMTGAWEFIKVNADYPWLVVVGIALFVISWSPYLVRRYLMQWPTKAQFEQDFDDERNADARDSFVDYANQSV